MESSTLPLPGDLRWRRTIGIALFLFLLYFFRKLAPVFICFVVFERLLGWGADFIDKRTRLERKGAIALLLTVLAAVIGGVVFYVVHRLTPVVSAIRTQGADSLRSIFDHPSIVRLRAVTGIDEETVTHTLRQHAGAAVHYATETAHILLFILIGVLLGVIYLFERKDIDEWYGGLAPHSVIGTLARWFGYVGDAIVVTVRMQLVVAVVNAVVTLPILLALRLPHVPLLSLIILVTGLLPVVGNVISGAVLCYVAYTARGAWAVGVFVGVTFALHKVESYYLNPRLAAQHVKLPGLVLVISLLLFEQAFGFIGLFLSFPALYVASRIAYEFQTQPTSHATTPVALAPPPAPSPPE